MPLVLVSGAGAPIEGVSILGHSIRVNGLGVPRLPSATTVDWCGAGQPNAVDRKPEADYSSFRHVHVTYVIPSDAPSRLTEVASAIVTDLSTADAWWQREDPTRTVRFDRFAFPGCASKLGALDLGFIRLPRAGSAYTGDEGFAGMLPELTTLAALSFHKHLVYYDGAPLFDPAVCGTTLVSRNAPDAGGLAGIAFIWLRSLCGQDIGTGNLNAEVVTHELIHAIGAIGRDGSPNECPPPNRGHVCDSELDILYPEASLETTLASKRLDVNRDDYYDHRTTAVPDLRDSAYLTRLPQHVLELAVQLVGRARGTIRMTSPVSFDCKDACSLELDRGLSVTLVATPSRGSRFLGWTGACKGKGACYSTLDGERTVSAWFGPASFRLSVIVAGKGRVSSAPAGLACPTRCTAAFKADSTVRLRAVPAPGHRFAGWAGDCRGRSICVVKLERDRLAKATFRRVG